jgi:RimJ/RimL family protein N-acetyltransferase
MWLNWTVRRRDRSAAVGWVQATVTDACAEIAYATLASERGHGYAREAVAAMVEWLRDRLAVQSIEAHIDPANGASAGVASGLGMRATDELDDGEVVWRL